MNEPKYTYTCDIFSASVLELNPEATKETPSETVALQLGNGARAVFRATLDAYPLKEWKDLWTQIEEKHMAYLPLDMSIKYLNMERPTIDWEVFHTPSKTGTQTTIMVLPKVPVFELSSEIGIKVENGK